MKADGYTAATQRLKRYADLNRSDCLFDRAKHEIVYVFDTSVIESYWRREPSGTSGKYGTDRLVEPLVAEYSGWLALKYLHEHRLPGQKQPAFISPSHWNESLERVRKLLSDTRVMLHANPSANGEQFAEGLA